MIVVAVIQCLQYYFYSICKYMYLVSQHSTGAPPDRHNTNQEVALYTVYCEYIRILRHV